MKINYKEKVILSKDESDSFRNDVMCVWVCMVYGHILQREDDVQDCFFSLCYLLDFSKME